MLKCCLPWTKSALLVSTEESLRGEMGGARRTAAERRAAQRAAPHLAAWLRVKERNAFQRIGVSRAHVVDDSPSY
ncbi:hypothetical protein NQZ68_030972 [Dissostichus eleginoides]|nr:hypothetical protein NQZ68_030972 [Dissostichus eleginoides]